jgi:ATP/maltotriose-dependent transcriptional regulator MalT
MSAIDLAAVVLSVTCLVMIAVATLVTVRLRSALGEVRTLIDEVRSEASEISARLDAQAVAVDTELHRIDGLVDRADKVAARADTLSRMTYGAVARPVIKTAAVVKGTSRAAQRLRGAAPQPGSGIGNDGVDDGTASA